MKKPRICTVITRRDEIAIREAEPFTELFEVRIDLIGEGWQEIVGQIGKPWIACARSAGEGGEWSGSEELRLELLAQAIDLGCDMVDIELRTLNLNRSIETIKNRGVKCLISLHLMDKTPPLGELRKIVEEQLRYGADICKVITTARKVEDNLTALELIRGFPATRLVSFAMGMPGVMSRIMCPLVGGDFTYASIEEGRESAPGQITLGQLKRIYEMMAK
ncbi:MAG: type I 3-dehydroquinate dehydratase [Dehalococcoidales bacterium]